MLKKQGSQPKPDSPAAFTSPIAGPGCDQSIKAARPLSQRRPQARAVIDVPVQNPSAQFPFRNTGTTVPSSRMPSIFIPRVPIMKSSCTIE